MLNKIFFFFVPSSVAIFALAGMIRYYQQDNGILSTFLAIVASIAIYGILFIIGKKDKKKFKIISFSSLLLFLFLFFFSFLGISLHYSIATFPLSDVQEVIETLEMPLDGFSRIFIREWLLQSLPLAILIGIFFIKPLYHACRNKAVSILIILLVLTGIMIHPTILFLNRVHIDGTIRYASYFLNLNDEVKISHTDFLEKNLFIVNPEEVRADSSTRNLIFIIMESAENTFNAQMQPLDSLSNMHLSFTDDSSSLGGGFTTEGATNTIQGSIAKTTGVPLLMLSQKTMSIVQRSSDSFFGTIPSIYDILHHFNYRNVFLQGSNSDFAKTRVFFLTHGADVFYDNMRTSTINDISNAKSSSNITEGFVEAEKKRPDENWKDAYLLKKARTILDTLGTSQGIPFSLTITTMDTHFPYGFYDKNCKYKPKNETEEEILKATYQCSSREISDFISWVSEQPYGPNTEVVVMGDHIFMGKVIVENIDKSKRRWTNLFINPQLQPSRKNRIFSSFDAAPTILESMGFHLKDSKMGIGTSLYSETPTLVEILGTDSLNKVLRDVRNSQEYMELMVH